MSTYYENDETQNIMNANMMRNSINPQVYNDLIETFQENVENFQDDTELPNEDELENEDEELNTYYPNYEMDDGEMENFEDDDEALPNEDEDEELPNEDDEELNGSGRKGGKGGKRGKGRNEDDDMENFEDDDESLPNEDEDEALPNEDEDGELENFENNEDMELWTCYPTNNGENVENFEGNAAYSADGNVSLECSIKDNANDMNKLYMYLAIAVIILIIIYLLTNKK